MSQYIIYWYNLIVCYNVKAEQKNINVSICAPN